MEWKGDFICWGNEWVIRIKSTIEDERCVFTKKILGTSLLSAVRNVRNHSLQRKQINMRLRRGKIEWKKKSCQVKIGGFN